MTSQIPLIFSCHPVSWLMLVLTMGASPLLCLHPGLQFRSLVRSSYFSSCIGVWSICAVHLPLCSVLFFYPLKHFPLLTLLTSVSSEFPSLLIFTPHRLLDPCSLSFGKSLFIASSSSWCKRMRGKTTKAVSFRRYQRTSFLLAFCLDSFLSFRLLDSKIVRRGPDLGKRRKEDNETVCGFVVKATFW